MQKRLVISVALAVVLISGCAQKAPEIDAGVVDNNIQTAVNTDASGVESGADSVDTGIDQMSTVDSGSVVYDSEDQRMSAVTNELQAIYFGTDRYDISATESEKIDADANILNGGVASDLTVSIEGNCDEWGTDEYNYALGLKRAKAMKESLVTAGVSAERMSIISFGESKPKCFDHNAECWQENRRADINIFVQ